ncbi:TonB-dependent siderophore receptor [Leptolyngbya sp. AN03gr2]|uniref:TonB-dependent siderophore receptor n=1 Tax=unclassified Leptolyngbya TaxID=2650499 RepID=UPI003D31F733
MSVWLRSLFVSSAFVLVGALSALATEPTVSRLQDRPKAATTVKEWMAQTEAQQAQLVRVTGVKVNPTQQGLEIALETENGQALQATQQAEGDTLILTVPNAVLALSSGQAFEVQKPSEGIDRIAVTQADATTIRVSITGLNDLPSAEIVAGQGLVLAVTPEEGMEEEITVTGEGEGGYRVPNASTATRTDTPIRDIPQSIQVVPQEVLRDQQVTTLNDALKNVSGATQTAPGYYNQFASFTIRGFEARDDTGNFTRNGLSYAFGGGQSANFANIEQIEVLRGPASVLFGGGNPGGTINIVTKQPLREPYASVEATIGSYNFYRGVIDLSGPLADDKSILYRLTASYENAGSFADFSEREVPAFAGVLRFDIGKNTTLTLDSEYSKVNQGYNNGLPAVGTILPNPNGEIPRNRNISEPDSLYSPEVFRVGYRLEHRFNENWSLQNAFYFSNRYLRNAGSYFISGLDSDLRTVQRGIQDNDYKERAFDFTTNLVGKFSTGSVQHQLLFGVDLRRLDRYQNNFIGFNGTPLDLFNPVYSRERFDVIFSGDDTGLTDSLGIYIQDQITLAENLKLLVGGRFDTFKQTTTDLISNTEQSQSGNAFSPRLGIVYQPIPSISLYASYSRSFTPTSGRTFDGSQFKPGRGTQYEVGVKANLNNRLSATLAFYDLTRSNVVTTDPANPTFSVQTGEQNSRGIELNIAGEVLPGWNVIAGYSYTDAQITQDNSFQTGNRLNNVPENSFNLWTTYELQSGSLKGVGFGLGFFYVGDRQGDLANTFALPSYFRTDAAIFYKRDRFRAALNIRNLFNVNYFESAYSDLTVYPAEPLTVQGTISWQF